MKAVSKMKRGRFSRLHFLTGHQFGTATVS
jgi:hypothetical protein